MNQENQPDENWKQLMKTLFPPYQHPNPEAFITRVMTQIENQSPRQPHSVGFSWKIPVFSLTGICMALLVMVQPSKTLSTESLFLGESTSDKQVNWAFQNETPESDDLLAFVLEEGK